MQTLTHLKAITPFVTRENGRVEIEYKAEFDGNCIGIFATQGQAENELNQHVLLLCEQGLIDQPLAALAEQALAAANPVLDADPWDDGPSQEEQAAAAARWTPCEGGWEQYTPHPFDPAQTVRLFQPRLFGAAPLPSGPLPAENPPGGDGVPGDNGDKRGANAGRTIARHFHRRPRHFIETLRRLDPSIWHLLASAYVAYRGGTVDQTLTAWWLAVSETQHIPADYRADFVAHPIVQAADASAESYANPV